MANQSYGSPLPGSTAWAAEQIKRILDREERQPHNRVPTTPAKRTLSTKPKVYPVGSVDWAAQKIFRILEGEERKADDQISLRESRNGMVRLAGGRSQALPGAPLFPPGFTPGGLPRWGVGGLTGKAGEIAVMRWFLQRQREALREEQANDDSRPDDREAECEQQALEDEAVCRRLPSPAVRARCWESVQQRYGACVRGKPLPPLITW